MKLIAILCFIISGLFLASGRYGYFTLFLILGIAADIQQERLDWRGVK